MAEKKDRNTRIGGSLYGFTTLEDPNKTLEVFDTRRKDTKEREVLLVVVETLDDGRTIARPFAKMLDEDTDVFMDQKELEVYEASLEEGEG